MVKSVYISRYEVFDFIMADYKHPRENYTDFETPDEIKVIFENIEKLMDFSKKNMDTFTHNTELLTIMECVMPMYKEMTNYNKRRDKEYWHWENTREKSQTEIECERYNYPA